MNIGNHLNIRKKGLYIEKFKALIIFYDKSSVQVKVAFWFTLCNFLQKGISMITLPIFTRLLNTAEYGQYRVYNTWQSLLFIIITFDLSFGNYNNALTKYNEDQYGYNSAMQGLTIAIEGFFFFIYLCFSNVCNSLLSLPTELIVAIFIQAFITQILGLWIIRQRYSYKYKTLVFATILMTILSPIIGVLAVLNSQNKVAARVWSTIFVQAIFALVILIYTFIKGKKIYDKKYWYYAFKLNIVLIPHSLSAIALCQVDRLMINSLCGSMKAGIYSVAYNAAMTMNLVLNSITDTYSVVISKNE